MSGTKKVAGPASYFPSIEHKYGYPLKQQKQLKHMEMVTWLKSKYKIGHGHANALVAYFRNQETL